MKHISNLFSQYKGLRKEIYILCIGRIVTSLGAMIWSMLTLVMNGKMGLDASTIAVIMVASSVIMIPANLIGGKIADKRNKRLIIIYCDVVSIICYVVCGIIPLSYATLILMVTAAIFQSVEGPSYSSLFADLSSVGDRERVFSLSYLCMNLGMVLSPTLGGLLFENYLWLMFIICAVSIGLSTVLIFSFIKDITPVRDESKEAEYQNDTSNKGFLQVLKNNRSVVLFMVVISIYYAAYGQWSYLLPLDIGRVHGGNEGALIYGTVNSLNCIVVVIFTPIITSAFKRVVEAKKLLAGILLVSSGYVMFLVLIGNIPVYYAATFLFTLGEIFSTIAEGPYITRRMPAAYRGRINGMSSVIGTVIFGVSQIAVGRAYDNISPTASWIIVLSLLGAASSLTVYLIFHDKKKYPKLYARDATE